MMLRELLIQKAKKELSVTIFDDGLKTYTDDEIEKTIVKTMTDLDDYIERVRLNWDDIWEELLK